MPNHLMKMTASRNPQLNNDSNKTKMSDISEWNKILGGCCTAYTPTKSVPGNEIKLCGFHNLSIMTKIAHFTTLQQ